MSDPRWLDEDEQRSWVAFLFASRLLWSLIERDLQRDSQLPYTHYEILVVLSEVPGRSMRMSDLAAAMQISRSRLSQAVARLEASGWVRRETWAADRRGAVAVLTDAGFEVLVAAAPHHVESVRRHLFDQLTAGQLGELRSISETLLRHLIPALGMTPGQELPGPLLELLAQAAGADCAEKLLAQ
jgi:DNA-binding MarR family transcriptional regulator